MKMITVIYSASITAIGICGRLLQAAEYQLPSWAASASAQHSSWDKFTVAVGGSGNSPDVAGISGDALLFQRTPGAIVTGTGNIYNPAGPSRFEITDAFERPLKQVVLQIETSGTELDYVTVALKAGDASGILVTERHEISRVSGPMGSTVLSRWQWDLTGSQSTNLVISFQTSGQHNSLTAARLDLLFQPNATSLSRSEPALDRWNYPFNATPGTRAVASTFASVEEGVALQRHANFVIGFATAPEIPTGLSPDQYEILEAGVVLTTSANFQIEYDPTFDSELTYLPEEDARFIRDQDAGRPMELFGAGFRNGFTAATWEETSPYAPQGANSTVYPISLDAAGKELDASAVNFANPAQVNAFAVGQIDGITVGSMVPEDSPVHFELDLSQPGVVSYLQRSLAAGRLFLTVTSLHRGGRDVRSFPEYYTRDNLVGDAPTLELVVQIGDAFNALRIRSIHFEDGGPVLRFAGSQARRYQIQHTDNFSAWQTIQQPQLTEPEPGLMQWKDSTAQSSRYYRIQEIVD